MPVTALLQMLSTETLTVLFHVFLIFHMSLSSVCDTEVIVWSDLITEVSYLISTTSI